MAQYGASRRLFDVEQEAPHRSNASGRSRRSRPVADWGGDAVFARPPRRRFERSAAAPIDASEVADRDGDDAGSLVWPDGARDERPGIDDAAGHPLGLLDSGHPEPAAPAVAPAEMAHLPVRRRPAGPAAQLATRPDRVAQYAVLLGLLLVLVAALTAVVS